MLTIFIYFDMITMMMSQNPVKSSEEDAGEGAEESCTEGDASDPWLIWNNERKESQQVKAVGREEKVRPRTHCADGPVQGIVGRGLSLRGLWVVGGGGE